MIATGIKIKNVGMLEDVDLKFNKPLLVLYGEIQQGKTTVLNAIKWAFGGAFPSDLIRHGEKEARVEIFLDVGTIRRDWYIAKDKTTKAKDLVFVRDGKPVPSPVNEIKRLLNPFLLDQDHLRNMGETERKAYFRELFAVDTKDLDTELYKLDRDASDLRSKIKGYGEIDLAEVKPVDPEPFKQEIAQLRKAHEEACITIDQQNESASKRESDIARGLEKSVTLNGQIDQAEAALTALKSERETINAWLKNHPEITKRERPSSPDTTALEAKVSEAYASNVRWEQFLKNQKRSEQLKADEKKLADLMASQRKVKADKTAKLKGVSDTCGIPGLVFDEEGNFTYHGTQAGMLSTSQLMKLSSELSALYPPGFGIDLIDRAESLGKSIFDFIDRAKAEKKTILATVVGEKPAVVPAEVGVFVVTKGRVEEQELGITP